MLLSAHPFVQAAVFVYLQRLLELELPLNKMYAHDTNSTSATPHERLICMPFSECRHSEAAGLIAGGTLLSTT